MEPARRSVLNTLMMCIIPSAPAFSIMGSVVRVQGTDNPDKTWVQPEIILWG